MTEAQKKWLSDNPKFGPIGPPRPVRFAEWGTLKADGTYERLDNKPRNSITVGDGSFGVARIEIQGAQPLSHSECLKHRPDIQS